MQRYFSNKLIDNKFELKSDDIYHITRVMRMKTGDKIEVVYNEKVHLCCLEIVNHNVNVNILSENKKDEQRVCEKVLVIPVLKENKMDLILQKATELGVDKIIPIAMERCIVKVDADREEKKLERGNRICKEASEQSMRVTIPVITPVKKLEDLENMDGVKLVCSTIERKNTIKMFLQSHKTYDKIIIAIGPEGGLSLKEEQYLNSIGFSSVTLGNQIMRVETVPMFMLSVINYENME